MKNTSSCEKRDAAISPWRPEPAADKTVQSSRLLALARSIYAHAWTIDRSCRETELRGEDAAALPFDDLREKLVNLDIRLRRISMAMPASAPQRCDQE